MSRTIFTNGLVFDGTGAAPAPGEVHLEGERIIAVRPGWHEHDGDDGARVVDVTGCTVMPGLIESHAHLTFPSAVGHLTRRSTRRSTSASSTTFRACPAN